MSSIVVIRNDNGSYDQVLNAPLVGARPTVSAEFVPRLHRLVNQMQKDNTFHRAHCALISGIQSTIEHGAFPYLRSQEEEFAKALDRLESTTDRSVPVQATIAFLKASHSIVGQALVSAGDFSLVALSNGETVLTRTPRAEGSVENLKQIVKGTDTEELICAAPLVWNVLLTGSRDNVETILGELICATRQSNPTERWPIRADLAVKRFYEELFSDCARNLYGEANTPGVLASIKSCLPLLKKYSQSEDGLSPSECGYHEHSRAFYILQQSRLVEFEGINKDQKDEGKWHLTELGYACVETLLAEELYEEKMRLGTTSLYASLPFTESVSTETRRASAL